ncbi:Two-component response regulator ARR11 [Linum grandiflorum]
MLVRTISVWENVPWLTRENVASHLQKYRLYLSRLQKDSSDQKTSIGCVKYSDSPSSDAALFNVNYGIPNQERDRKGTLTVSSATAGRKRALTVDIPDTHMPAKASRTDPGHIFGSSSVPHMWDNTNNNTDIQLKEEPKPLHFDNLPRKLLPTAVDETPATTSSSTQRRCVEVESGCIPGFQCSQRRQNLGLLSPYPVIDEDPQLFLLQGGLQNVDFPPEYFDHHQGFISDDTTSLYDAARFDYDPTECLVIDQGLFIS